MPVAYIYIYIYTYTYTYRTYIKIAMPVANYRSIFLIITLQYKTCWYH